MSTAILTQPFTSACGRISKESCIIAAVGIADLVTTLVWVHTHGAQEANPVFAHYLAMGPIWFAAMKLVMLIAPLFLLEWARRRRPRFTQMASRFAIVAYVGMYVVGVARLNPQLFKPAIAHAGPFSPQRVASAHLLHHHHGLTSAACYSSAAQASYFAP